MFDTLIISTQANNMPNAVVLSDTLLKDLNLAENTQVPVASERTHFEVKYLARGEVCWQLDMIKPIGYLTRFD